MAFSTLAADTEPKKILMTARELEALKHVLRRGGEAKPAFVAERMGISQGYASLILHSLLSNDYVEFLPSGSYRMTVKAGQRLEQLGLIELSQLWSPQHPGNWSEKLSDQIVRKVADQLSKLDDLIRSQSLPGKTLGVHPGAVPLVREEIKIKNDYVAPLPKSNLEYYLQRPQEKKSTRGFGIQSASTALKGLKKDHS